MRFYRSRDWLVIATIITGSICCQSAQARELVTYVTGETPDAIDPMKSPDGQVVFRVEFNPAVKDSAKLSIAARESTGGLRLDNIDFVPGSGFSEVIVTAQGGGMGGADGALTRYNIKSGMELGNVITSTNGIAAGAPPPVVSRPASIVPNPAGTHYYYTENQFGFDGGLHRMIRVPIAGGAEAVAFDGGLHGLAELSGVEIIGDTMYFFARDTTLPMPFERRLYSVALAPSGLALPATMPEPEVIGLDRASPTMAVVGPQISDGSDEMDYDPSTGLLFGTNIATGEVIGFDIADTGPAAGPIVAGPALPFHIDDALITAAAGTVNDGLGLLSGVTTFGLFPAPPIGPDGPARQIDGIRPDGDGHLVVIGHEGVIVSIDIEDVLANGATAASIIRLFNRDVPGAGLTVGFDRDGLLFDDHTILAPIPEPSTMVLVGIGAVFFGFIRPRRPNRTF